MTLIIPLLELIAIPTLFLVIVVPFALVFDFLYHKALTIAFNQKKESNND